MVSKENNQIEKNKFSRIRFDRKKLSLMIVLLLLIIGMSLLSDRFLKLQNILNILTQVSINGVLAAGMTFVVITSGIDLSAGSVLAIIGVIFAMTNEYGIFAIIISLIAGLAIGFLNGKLITKFKIQPFIVTLASMTVFRGITYIITNGSPVSGISPGLQKLGTGFIKDIIPIPVVILVSVYIICHLVLTRTKLGRYTFAIGDNEEAARNSGINVDRYKTIIYMISGLMVAISAIIQTTRLNSAQPNAGLSYELDAVAAVAIGGTSLTGGVGSVGGTFIGVLILGIINNGLNLLNVSTYYQQVVKGIIILVAVIVDKYKDR